MNNENTRVFGRKVATSLTDLERVQVAGGVRPEFAPATTAITYCKNGNEASFDEDTCIA